MRRRKIVFAGESRGTAEVIAPLAQAFAQRGDEVLVLALGAEAETEAYGDIPLTPIAKDNLLTMKGHIAGCDLAIVGATGRDSLEWEICSIAKANGKPVIALLDNIDNLACRLPSDRTRWADHVIVSGRVGRNNLDEAIRSTVGSSVTADHERFFIMDNLRRDRALRERTSMTGELRAQFLSAALRDTRTRFPRDLRPTEVLDSVISGRRKLVILFTQNIEPRSSYWASYGKSVEERRELFNRKICLFLDVAGHLLRRGAMVAVRPHPRESETLSAVLSEVLGCIFLPRAAGDSMKLAMAARHIVTPPSSMIDQGPLHGARTAALLCCQPGPHHYEALMTGAAISAHHRSKVPAVLDELLADEPDAAERWRGRLVEASPHQPVAPGVVDHIAQWAGWESPPPV